MKGGRKFQSSGVPKFGSYPGRFQSSEVPKFWSSGSDAGDARSEEGELSNSRTSEQPNFFQEFCPLAALDELLPRLSGRERLVLQARFALPPVRDRKTFEQLGEMFGMSKQAAFFIYQQALRKLRQQLTERQKLADL